jgi:DNA-binding transcriptional regulator GbsR (MarR family)
MTATAEDGPRYGDPLDRQVLRICDAVGEFIAYWGFKSASGRVWALLALHREPLTQVEIAEMLGVSRALVSTTMAELVDRGLARPLGASRKAPYQAVIDVWPSISEVLRSREWQLVERARLAFESAIEQAEFEASSGREVRYDVDRMRSLLTMTEMAQHFLRTVISLRAPTSAKRLSSWVGKASSVVRGRVQALWEERRR